MPKIVYILFIIFVSIFILNHCDDLSPEKSTHSGTTVIEKKEKQGIATPVQKKKKDISEFEQVLIKAGLVNCGQMDTTLIINLKYSGTDNFLGIDLYGDFNECYLQKEVAVMLCKAHEYLKDTFPMYRIVIYDAARPQSIQQMMWDSIRVDENEKSKYLSKPEYGSLHNFGAAVDVGIVDEKRKELDMGTAFDSFDELAYPILEKQNLKKGLLSQQQVNNRKLLRFVMEKAGFFNIQTEWWHFNALYRKEAREKYAMIISHRKEEVQSNIIEKPIHPDITFRVQIKTSMIPISPKSNIFKGQEVYRYHHEGMYKYTTGIFRDIKSAVILRDKMKAIGFSDCFIAAFNNNERIGIRDAIEILQ